MSCHKGRAKAASKPKSNDCVCHVVGNIVKAQNEVADMNCHSGCNQSIYQLLSQGNGTGPQNTTIPFILYCKGACKPFIGSGVSRAMDDGGSFFECVETPVFKAKQFVKGSDCCVKLELLLPVSESCYPVKPYKDKSNDICSFFPKDDPIKGFVETGICLTVDLNDFTGITCLDPITPLTANEMTANVKEDKWY